MEKSSSNNNKDEEKNNNKDEENFVETVVNAFVSITSASVDDALTFLSAHEFNIGPAIEAYYDHRQQETEAAAIRNQPSIVLNPSPSPVPAAAMSSREDKNKKKAVSGGSERGGIRTVADLNRRSGPGSDSVSNGPQEYYTGGEKSGMLVQDPTKGGHNVDAIFDQARQMGAIQGPFDELHPSSSSRSFTGTGRLLSGETVPAAPRPPENIVHNIYFWTNGFTIDDGPLRRFDDPANALFLESIKRSECPKELEPEDRRSTVHVNLIRREENCPEPVRRLTPFQGVGRTLGGFAPSLCSESVAQDPAAAVSSAPAAAAPVVVDDSRPTTSVQLRLADGSRTVARFNTDHTVGDIRAFINSHAAIDGRAAPATYTLQTVGFPPKQLTDATETIEQAGLANSVVIQRL